ncbi:hypothetical protein EV426DRAFT_718859 [Tirmania nivea]|nr:hypothetical protein EV426DRAFT_718859 [Tirmania nivea]
MSIPTPPTASTAPPPPTPRTIPPITRIAILGGGPSGIAILARLLKFHPTHFPTIDLFEQRSDVGGIWNYTEETTPLVQVRGSDAPRVFLPLDDSRGRYAREVVSPVLVRQGQGEEHSWVFPSAIYPSLTANIPKQLMQWPDWPFGREVVMFPGHKEILEYVRAYFRRLGVREVRGRRGGVCGGTTCRDGDGSEREDRKEEEEEAGVRAWFGKVVRKVEKVKMDGREEGVWRIVVGDVGVDEAVGEERYYDAVAIASGRYSVPYIPSLPGLKEWVLAGKGERRVEHSREFREIGEKYKGKRILLVGASISAADILKLLIPLSPSLPIYQSMRSPIAAQSTSVIPVPAISHLDPITGTIHLQAPTSTACTVDPLSGEIRPPSATNITALSSIDVILFCTGYVLTAPYLPPMHYSTPSPRGTHIPHLLLQCISAPDPTLAWMGLPYRVAPFPTAAGQAGVVARLWSGVLTLPEIEAADKAQREEVEAGLNGKYARQWEGVLREMEGPGREQGAWTHLLTTPRDLMFLERLAGLCRAADERGRAKDGAERRWMGDYAVWSEYLSRVRMRLGEVRERYNKAVGEGRTVRGLEEIGLGWEEVMGESKGADEGAGGDRGKAEVEVGGEGGWGASLNERGVI